MLRPYERVLIPDWCPLINKMNKTKACLEITLEQARMAMKT